jgi:hypothetical protein
MAEALGGLQNYPCIKAKLYRGPRIEGDAALVERFANVSATFLRPMAKHVREVRVFRRWPAARENAPFSRLLLRGGRSQFLDIRQPQAFDAEVVWRGASDTGLLPIFVLGDGALSDSFFVSALNIPRPLSNPGVMVGTSGLKFARGDHVREGEVRFSPALSVYDDPEILIFAAARTIAEIFVSAMKSSEE